MTTASRKLIGTNHNDLLTWLSNTWMHQGPPVCFVEGFPGIGKTTVATDLLERVSAPGQPAVFITAPSSPGDPTDDLLLLLATEFSGIGHSELADAIDEGRSLTAVLSTLIEKPVLIIIDEFQRSMRASKGIPKGGFAKVLNTLVLKRHLKGRILLLTNRLVDRSTWSEPYEIRTLRGMAPEDAQTLLGQLLSQADRRQEVPEERYLDVVKWLGCNPRAIRVLVATLAYDSLENLIGLQPELWEGRDRHVAPELVAELEQNLLDITLRQLTEEDSRCLNRLAVHRIPFEGDAIERLFSDRQMAQEFRRKLIDRFLMEHHRGIFELHPLVRETAIQKLRSVPAELTRAHSVAGDHYIRHFKAQRIVGWGRLGGRFVEARYHLVRAGRDGELREATSRFSDHIRSTLSESSPVPTDSIELDERIAVLASLLETPGPKGLEYHLARLFKVRGRRNDLERARLHIRRALGSDAWAPRWLLASQIEVQAGRIKDAIEVLKEGIANVPPTQNLFSLYQSAGELLAQEGRTDEAIALLKGGIGRVPPTQHLVSLYQSAGELLAQEGRTDEAIELLKEGIGRVPPQNLFSLYQSAGELLTQAGRTDEAIELLKEGIANVPPTQNLFSLYQSAGELLAQEGRTDEAIGLLKEGIRCVPPEKGLVSLYQSLSGILIHSGQIDAAKRIVKEGVRIVPAETGGYAIAHGLLSLLAGTQAEMELSGYLNGMDANNPIFHLGQIYLMQLQNHWQAAAEYGDTARARFATNMSLSVVTALSWIGARDWQRAWTTIEQSPKQWFHKKGNPLTWLVAFIVFKRRVLAESERLLSIYIGGERNADTGLNDDVFLSLWNQPSTPWGRPDLAYYFPILPPSITGLEASVTRISYHPFALPAHLTQEATAVASTTHSLPTKGISMDMSKVIEEKRSRAEYDVFLCHNSKDKPAVKRIGEALLQQGILPWLDEWDAPPGKRWQRLFEEQIVRVRSAAVFVGPQGLGPWQTLEYESLLQQFVRREVPIIPVLLPECSKSPQLPLFLEGFGWVDFRTNMPDPLRQLIWGITGERPEILHSEFAGQPAPKTADLLADIRNIVHEEVDLMRAALETRVSRESANVLDTLTYSQVAIISELSEVMESNRVPEASVKELLEAVQELRNNPPSNKTLANAVEALPPIMDDAKASIVQRLKVTIPILPLLLSYEGEYDLSSGMNITSLILKVVEKIRH